MHTAQFAVQLGRVIASTLLREGSVSVIVDGQDVTHRCAVDHERGTITLHEHEVRYAAQPIPKKKKTVKWKDKRSIPKKKKTAQWKAERSRFGRY